MSVLHTCQRCGEAWSGEYILTHLDHFELADEDRATVTGCPDCLDDFPGLPGISTRRALAVARVVRCSDTDWMVVGSMRHYATVGEAVAAAHYDGRGVGLEVVV